MISDKYLLHTFHRFNKKFFGGRLEEPIVCWGSMRGAHGRYIPKGFARRYRAPKSKKWLPAPRNKAIILISHHYRDKGWTANVELALLHEMVHMSLPNRVQHGKPFQREMLRLAKAGAFRMCW